ncbi:MAG: hypothetical protein JWQ30_537, partial [Sediminibacterium sp.]|nr:hypothetical protein [Sediminibacterium sp.]
KRITMYMAVIAMLILSCSTKNKQEDLVVAKMESFKPEPGLGDQNKIADSVHTGRFLAPAAPQSKTAETHEDWDKKIIKTAEVTLELKDYSGYNQTIHKGLKAYGAYIASEEQVLSDDRNANNISIKVPVDQFENLMNSFSGEGIKVLQKKISSEDVTGEVVDTRSRLEAKKQMRDRYLGLLKQAKNMKEILEVENEINAIQESIESASGRVGYLTHQSAYSTIHLQYFQYLNPDNRVTEPSGFFVKLRDSFKDGLRILSGLLLGLVSIWPLIAAGIIAFIFVWKKRKLNITKP